MKRYLRLLLLSCMAQVGISQVNHPLETIIQRGHLQYVSAAAFSPDGKYIATGSLDNSIKVWNKITGKEIRSLNLHTGKIMSLEFSKDGQQILSTGSDNKIILYNVVSGDPVQILTYPADRLQKAVLSPGERYILAASERDKMIVWDKSSGEKVNKFMNCFGTTISKDYFSPDDTKIITYKNYQSVIVRDVITGDSLLGLPFDKPNNFKFSPGGQYIGVGSTKLFCTVFDAKSGQEINTYINDKTKKCDGCNTFFDISEDEKMVLVGSKKSGLVLWNLKKGKKIQEIDIDDSWLSGVKISSDGQYLMAYSTDLTRIFQASTGKLIIDHDNKASSGFEANFGPGNQNILLPGTDNKAFLYSLPDGIKSIEYSGFLNKTRDDGLRYSYENWTDFHILKYLSYRSGVQFSPDGKYFIRGKTDSTAVLVNVETGAITKRLTGHSKVVHCYDFSPDGKLLATAGGDGTIIIRDFASGNTTHTLVGHRDIVFDIHFSHNNQYLVSTSWDGTLRVWEMTSGKEIQYINQKTKAPYLARFTPNDLYILSSDLADRVNFYEADAGEVFRPLVGHTALVTGIAFHPGGKSFATASLDGKVKVWDLLTGMQTNKFPSHGGAVYSVAYDPSGKRLFSAGADKKITIRETTSGKTIKVLDGHSNAVTSLSVSSDGKKMLSCSIDGVIKLWDLATYQEVYTYILINSNEWLAKTPPGYFDGSPGALKYVNYVAGMEVVPIGSLFEKYFTPGLIKRISSGETFSEKQTSIRELIKSSPGIELAIGQAGKRAITAIPDSHFVWRNSQLNLQVKINEGETDADEIRIYNNGKLIITEQASNEITFRGGNGVTKEFEIELANGKNKISAVVIDKNRTESSPAELNVIYDGEDALIDLFVFAIGINKYKNPKYKLNYAKNDAKTYMKTLISGADTIFNDIESFFISDEEANKQTIREQFGKITAQAGPEDVFVFYYAGHGVMSMEEEGRPSDFFMVTHDITNLYGDNALLFDKAVSARELMEFSRQIAAEKQLFIIDACQSGGAINTIARRGVGREKAIAQLARSTGTFFLTASQDIQYANESGNLKHGLFTYAILEALEGKADGGTKDHKVTVNEMKAYVEDRVPELSEKYHGSAQYPVSYSFGQDFPVVIVK